MAEAAVYRISILASLLELTLRGAGWAISWTGFKPYSEVVLRGKIVKKDPGYIKEATFSYQVKK